MSGDVWVFGLNASLAWWLIHRVRAADRVGQSPGPAGSPAWWGAQPSTDQYRIPPLGEEDRQN